MSEKVIGEIRFIESEDGFRIEVKGDKEQLKRMGWKPGAGPGFMWMGGSRKKAWRDMESDFTKGHRHGFGRHFGPGKGFSPGRRGPCFWWYWDTGEDEEGKEFD